MGHGTGDTAITRRALLGLMAAAAARPTGGEASSTLERAIPSSGERIPAVGLGTWRTFDVGASKAERDPLADVLGRFIALGGA